MKLKTYKITEKPPFNESTYECDMIIVTSLGSIFLDAGKNEVEILRENYDFFSIVNEGECNV